MNKPFLMIVVVFYLTISSCTKNNQACEGQDIIDGSKIDYVTDPYTLKSANITGNCIKIVIEASGCSGDTWTAELISIEELRVANTVTLGLALKNDEPCRAVKDKTFYFNLKKLRNKETRNRTIKLMHWDKEFIYRW